MPSTVARPEEMESSDDEFVDAFEYLPEESNPSIRASDPAENSSQDNPTEKYTKWRKGQRTVRRSRTFSLESAAATDPLKTGPKLLPPTIDNLSGLGTVRKVVKKSSKTATNKVGSLVKRSRTFSLESAAATDPLKTGPKLLPPTIDNLSGLGTVRKVVKKSSKTATNKVCSLVKRSRTFSRESAAATDPLKTGPKLLPPTIDNLSGLGTVRKVVKKSSKTATNKVCSLVKRSRTFSRESAAATDPLKTGPKLLPPTIENLSGQRTVRRSRTFSRESAAATDPLKTGPKLLPPTIDNLSGLGTVRKVVKKSSKTATNKVCSLVKRSRTFSRESAAATDPLKTGPKLLPPTIDNLSGLGTVRKVVKKSSKTATNKVCSLVKRSRTFSRESAAATDPLKTGPKLLPPTIENLSGQRTVRRSRTFSRESAAATDPLKTGPKLLPPTIDNLSGLGTVRKVVKKSSKTVTNKVGSLVKRSRTFSLESAAATDPLKTGPKLLPPTIENLSGQRTVRRSRTFSRESAAATDPLKTGPKLLPPTIDNLSGLGTVRKVVKKSSKTVTNKVGSLVKRSRTFSRESAAATDPLETEPMRDYAQPLTSVSVRKPPSTSTSVRKPASTSASVRKPPSTSTSVRKPASTSASVRKPPSTSTSVRKPPSTSASVRKPPSTSSSVRKPPSTSSSVRKPPSTSTSVRKPTSTSTSVRKPISTSASVGTSVPTRPSTSASVPTPPSTSASVPTRPSTSASVPTPPSTSSSVPTPPPPAMENLSACFITLEEFIRKKGSSMKEKDVRIIMRQIFVALKNFWELGVYLPINVEGIAIDPNTLQIKITDSSQALTKPSEKMTGRDQASADAWFKRCAILKHSESYFKVMYALVKDINPPFWKRRLSKECSNLLRRLETQRGLQLLTTLQNILNDPWFTVNQPMIAGSGSFGAGFTKIILRKGLVCLLPCLHWLPDPDLPDTPFWISLTCLPTRISASTATSLPPFSRFSLQILILFVLNKHLSLQLIPRRLPP
ncbi:mucin-5AC-like [Pseudorasbora parva]|uniref:mucin-5AC-like n=1 Tax=Pseudorasbora parva TaxID=51549 RepID=UPI00351F1482